MCKKTQSQCESNAIWNLMNAGSCIFLSVGKCISLFFITTIDHVQISVLYLTLSFFFCWWSNTKEKATWKQSSNPLMCSFAYIHSSYTLILHVYTKILYIRACFRDKAKISRVRKWVSFVILITQWREKRCTVYFLNETNLYLFSMRVIGENVIQILEYYY